MDYLKVEGHDNLYRDPQTNSIVTMDNTGYDEYISRRNIKNDEHQKVQNVEQDLANLKSEISEIKSLLKELVSNG